MDAARLKINLTIFRERAGRGRGGEEERRRHGNGAGWRPRWGTGPRYNVQSMEGPLRYPTPPELVLLYNAQRGTPVSGEPKSSLTLALAIKNGPPENLRKTSGSISTGHP